MECVEIEDKISRKGAARYESDLKFYFIRKKGYQAMISYFVQETNDYISGLDN